MNAQEVVALLRAVALAVVGALLVVAGLAPPVPSTTDAPRPWRPATPAEERAWERLQLANELDQLSKAGSRLGQAVTPESPSDPTRSGRTVEMTNNVQPPPGAVHAPVTPGTPPAVLPELPVCGGPATCRVELYNPVDGRAHGRLEGTVSVCTGDLDYVRATVIAAGLTPYVLAGGDEIKRCGDGVDLSDAVRLVLLTPPDMTAGPVARPVVTPQPAGRRIARANMLRALSRLCYAVERPALPAPVTVRFMDGPGSDRVVIVRCDAIAEAEEWATHFDVMRGAQIIDTISEAGHQVRVFSAWAQWRGFSLVLSAVVPPEGDPVPAVRPTSPVTGAAAVGALR